MAGTVKRSFCLRPWTVLTCTMLLFVAGCYRDLSSSSSSSCPSSSRVSRSSIFCGFLPSRVYFLFGNFQLRIIRLFLFFFFVFFSFFWFSFCLLARSRVDLFRLSFFVNLMIFGLSFIDVYAEVFSFLKEFHLNSVSI